MDLIETRTRFLAYSHLWTARRYTATKPAAAVTIHDQSASGKTASRAATTATVPPTVTGSHSRVARQGSGWRALTTDPLRDEFAWCVRYHPDHGRTVLLVRDEDASEHHIEWHGGSLLFRSGGYWWDGATWYGPARECLLRGARSAEKAGCFWLQGEEEQGELGSEAVEGVVEVELSEVLDAT
ncbi:hypothetical protein AQI70_14030 [Streptomyces curacoi]|uniref:Uncharacterized protein n=1 Tax=Streptomyces curacoi TaxID=146536 RepID=A0A117PCL5_9ACTN|nr:hypothetical protein AQI70_14030 [Streptomyces curacoi]